MQWNCSNCPNQELINKSPFLEYPDCKSGEILSRVIFASTKYQKTLYRQSYVQRNYPFKNYGSVLPTNWYTYIAKVQTFIASTYVSNFCPYIVLLIFTQVPGFAKILSNYVAMKNKDGDFLIKSCNWWQKWQWNWPKKLLTNLAPSFSSPLQQRLCCCCRYSQEK